MVVVGKKKKNHHKAIPYLVVGLLQRSAYSAPLTLLDREDRGYYGCQEDQDDHRETSFQLHAESLTYKEGEKEAGEKSKSSEE